MEIKAEQKYLLMSPKKIRGVISMLKSLKPTAAADALALINKRGAEPLRKVILAALASSKLKGLNETELYFKEIVVNEGPRLKRGQPVSRGQWHPFKRRMSHIRVVLDLKKETPKSEGENVKSQNQKKVVKEVLPKGNVEKGAKNGPKS